MEDEKWVVDIRKISYLEGKMASAFLLVRGSDLTVRGTMQLRGPATSAWLAVLQMHSLITVRDLTVSSRRTRSEASTRRRSSS